MKKILFTLIAAIAFCGSIFAQAYETHWPDFDPYAYPQHGDIMTGNLKIDNNYIEGTDNWEAFELGAFVDGVIRGHTFMNYYPELDEYPIVQSFGIYYSDEEEDEDLLKPVTFVLYDHSTNQEYTFYTCSKNIRTGYDYGTFSNPVIFSFFHTFTKVITPYTADGDGWHFITSPLQEAVSPGDVLNMTTPNNYDLYAFDQTAALEWLNYKAEAFETLEAGKGYLYANGGDESGEPITLTFIGAPYAGNGEVPLEYSEANEDPSMWGWNLVGNPYDQVASIDRTEYYRMKADGSEVIPGEDDEIGAMEGIFVQANGNDETVTFSPAQPQPSNNGKGQIVLNVTQDRGNLIDRAIVRFGQGGVLPKFMLNENHTKLYISKDDNNYAVVRSKMSGSLPVNFQPAEDGTYTINVDAESMNMKSLHLIDNLTGADINLLRTPSYSFDASTTDNADRFVLVFKVAITPINPLFVKDDTKGFGFFSNGEWIINNEGEAILQVVDVNGQILSSEEINGSVSKHIEAAPGVYMLRLINGKDMKVQKIVVE